MKKPYTTTSKSTFFLIIFFISQFVISSFVTGSLAVQELELKVINNTSNMALKWVCDGIKSIENL